MQHVKDVSGYITNVPEEIQGKLNKLREVIKKTAPKAKEMISYGMPYYSYKGRLVYFALMKNHIGLYIPPPIIEQYKNELRDYITTKSAIHIPLKGELPVPLIHKLVKARIKWNEEVEKIK